MTAWFLATRPKTLPAAIVPVGLGCALAYREGMFGPVPATLCLAFALLVQIGTNFANDYYDFLSGADREDRIGPVRAVAGGLIAPKSMWRAACSVFLAALIVGSGLIYYGGWWLLLVGIASVLSGIAYTGGPFPLGYHGLGDFFAFLFFGVVAVTITYHVQVGTFTLAALLVSLSAGSLITNILVVNNCRDMDTDVAAGKKTLVVRFGRRFAFFQYQVLFLVALLIPIVLTRIGFSAIVLLPLLVWPWSLSLRRQLRRAREGPEYNRILAHTALFLLGYGALFSVGLALG